jgi:RNA polymerase sigma-70 factor (ECF subfamily)
VSDDARRAPSGTDQEAQRLAESGDLAGAATLLIQTYGPGVIGWLRAITASPDEADEAFAATCERLWRALPEFQWPGAPKTWLYTVGRNVVIDRQRRGTQQRNVPLSGAPPVAAVVRSTTAAYRKTHAKQHLQELRDALDPQDRSLLILRIDRGMAWSEIGAVLCDDGTDPEAIKRASARARKRFERVKSKLREQWETSTDR